MAPLLAKKVAAVRRPLWLVYVLGLGSLRYVAISSLRLIAQEHLQGHEFVDVHAFHFKGLLLQMNENLGQMLFLDISFSKMRYSKYTSSMSSVVTGLPFRMYPCSEAQSKYIWYDFSYLGRVFAGPMPATIDLALSARFITQGGYENEFRNRP